MPSTSLDAGLEEGLRYAAEHAADRRRLGLIARAHSAAEVAAVVDGSAVAPDGIDDVVAYWSGFAHGVRQYLQDHLGLE
jgi:hypothetical protein